MSRAGREPAEDVKRRIATACKEAGLIVTSSRMYLIRDENCRIIFVQAARPDRPGFECSILTRIEVTGGWTGKLDIRCAAWEKESNPLRVWETPVMRGRGAVPVDELAVALMKTIEEQEQVVAAIKMGVDGPYTFVDTRWDKPSDAMGM